MRSLQKEYSWCVWVTILLAFFLQLVSLEGVLNALRPFWLLLVVSFWVFSSPDQVKLTLIWLMTLLMDVVTGSLIGEHGIAMVLCVGILMALRKRVVMSPLPQQALVILLVCFLYALCISSIQQISGRPVESAWFWFAPLLSTIIWCLMAVYMNSRIVRHDVL
jgi:rod shape-determining protein MreD